MGLLDTGGFDDPNTVGLLSLGARLSNTPGGFMRALAPSVLGALGDRNEVKSGAMKQQQEALRLQLLQQQMEDAQRQRQQEAQARANLEAFRAKIQSPQMAASQSAMAGGGGPTNANAAQMPSVDPRQQMMYEAMNLGQMTPMDYIQSTAKDDTPVKLGAGEVLLGGRASGYKPLASAPNKPAELPSAVREYEYARQQGYQGSFEQFQLAQKKAGATNIGMPKIEVKMGESVAGQIGPMAKDSKIMAQGAVTMFDSADRIQKALDSGKVSSGPFTTQVQTVKQLIQKVGGGNDDSIRQTRQVIKGLAQMSVEARKQLQGQGQVTESEAAAVAKADSGDINDLTTGELQDLVTLTKRAAHFTAMNHQQVLNSMGGSDATKGMIPFYQVPNVDRLLKHSPQLPNIGGSSALDSALKQYGPK